MGESTMNSGDPDLDALRSIAGSHDMPLEVEERVRARLDQALTNADLTSFGPGHYADDSDSQDAVAVEEILLEPLPMPGVRRQRAVGLVAAAIVLVAAAGVAIVRLASDPAPDRAASKPADSVSVFCTVHVGAYEDAFADYQRPALSPEGARPDRESLLLDALVKVSGELTEVADRLDNNDLSAAVATLTVLVEAAEEQIAEPAPVAAAAIGRAQIVLQELMTTHLVTNAHCRDADLAWTPLG
jgi:hypothetical protein